MMHMAATNFTEPAGPSGGSPTQKTTRDFALAGATVDAAADSRRVTVTLTEAQRVAALAMVPGAALLDVENC